MNISTYTFRREQYGNYSQLNDMGMSQKLQILYFSFDPASHVPRYELLARYDFQSHLLTTHSVYRKLDFAE